MYAYSIHIHVYFMYLLQPDIQWRTNNTTNNKLNKDGSQLQATNHVPGVSSVKQL